MIIFGIKEWLLFI